MSLNKAMLIGRLGKDPEIRNTQAGTSIANFSIATSETWKNKQGEKQEKTEWHNVVIFNEKLAELAGQYLKKGSQVYIEGKITTRKWEDKEGATRYTTEIVLGAYDGVMRFLGKPAGSSESDGEERESAKPKAQAKPKQQTQEELDDEVPF